MLDNVWNDRALSNTI
uniref:Uncharacterized protein n=1 Tax=Lepeophtheirus salmonis TaxID=72036 RepID=A0A0K2U9B5_LEPSM